MSDSVSSALVIEEILAGECPLSLGEVARRLPAHRPSRSGRTSPSCVWRWVIHGYKARDGRVVRLAAAKFAGRWITSAPSLARFAQSITDAALPAESPALTANRSTTASRKRTEGAKKKLVAAGA